MFGAFSANPKDASAPRDSQISETRPRPKRHQVIRACVWCQTYRIKCDASYPCRNCREKGRRCTTEKGKAEVRTLSHAIKEIDRLKGRVKELEEKLLSLGHDANSSEQQDKDLSPTRRAVSLPANLDPLAQHGGNKNYYNWDFVSASKSNHVSQTYGPSSSFYFVSQMTTYLDATLQHQLTSIHSACMRQFRKQPTIERTLPLGDDLVSSLHTCNKPDLSRPREESVLYHYWHTFHSIYPILDESEFRSHYDSLWDISGSSRQSSALVDMMLALCMQYRAALPIASNHNDLCMDSNGSDAAMKGHFWHRRGQRLLSEELEDPSVSTFQCHFLSVQWLFNAGLHNMAHSIMATGIRTGIVLGLHLEPAAELSPAQRDFRKRLWWTTYATEIKFAMELGRPLAVHISNVTCTLPGDDAYVPEYESHPSRVFNGQFIKLLLATRAIFVTFYRKCGEVLRRTKKKALHNDPKALEECAGYLASKLGYLHTWLQKVPETLKCSRNDSGEPFSTVCSGLNLRTLNNNAWARQTVILELLYHNLFMSLYRPFINFSTSSDVDNSNIKSHALSCASHAITITTIIHQVLQETTYLDGWVETYQWQWTAAISLAGYVIAYPVGPLASIARKALDTALIVFESLSKRLSNAVAAGPILRELISKADLFKSRAEQSHLDGTTPDASAAWIPGPSFPEIDGCGFDTIPITSHGMSEPIDDVGFGRFRDALAGASGSAFTFSPFPGFEEFSADTETMFDFLDLEETGRF